MTHEIPAATHSSDVVLFDPAMARELTIYANEIAPAALLPDAYRNKPADIIIAAQLGMAIGISPAQAFQEIAIVYGKPSLSAKLMAALVRRAGHTLRVEGDEESCTTTLIRKDDPDHPTIRTWTVEKARNANLFKNKVWEHFTGEMLAWRSISSACKIGAPECLLGIQMSTEEAYDLVVQGELADPVARPPTAARGLDAIRGAVETEPTAQEPAVAKTDPAPETAASAVVTPKQKPLATAVRNQLAASMNAESGFTSDQATPEGIEERMLFINAVLADRVTGVAPGIRSTRDLTVGQAEIVLDAVEAARQALASKTEDSDPDLPEENFSEPFLGGEAQS